MSELQLVSGLVATTCKSAKKFSVHACLDCVPLLDTAAVLRINIRDKIAM